jgi:DNA-binding LacI/PurR family transcriptional regulator
LTVRKTRSRRKPVLNSPPGVPTLKDLAAHLALSPATISLVLNRSPVADSIPQETQQRVFEAAREFGYRPHYIARSLRSRRTQSIGVLVPEVSDPWAAEIVSGIEDYVLPEGYHYLVTSHRRSTPKLLQEDLQLLADRVVDGMILLGAELDQPPVMPTVVISGRTRFVGLANVVIDHDLAARLALSHLMDLGHRAIALFKGQPGSADTDDRSRAILEAAGTLGLKIAPELTVQLSSEDSDEVFSPDDVYREGYVFAHKLLGRNMPFTALFAFDDASAIGAMRAFADVGLRVPQDISVVGFDDIQSAAFYNPRLTTVRQPLREMGQTAARVLLQTLDGAAPDQGPFIVLEPELIVRDSTSRARTIDD